MAIDVSEREFEAEVVQRSHQVPVVVDFWASWCAPCRQLTPALEQAEAARPGKVVLAKVDTDANPRISQAFGIQGIPAVKAFKDGRVVDEFVGAQPPAAVERFFDGLVPNEVDELVAKGDEASLRRAFELAPGRPDVAIPLARLHFERGEREEALALVDPLVGSFTAQGLAARIRLEQDEAAAEGLAEAFAALDRGETEQGLDGLIEAIRDARDGRQEDLRKVVVGVLDDLGVESPVAREYRRRLASALY